jgi:hypothetical protein
VTIEGNPVPPAEPGLPHAGAAAGPTPASGSTPAQLRLQILSTEHWSLLASRGLAWNESFARAGMFLSTLSGAMVALGLIAGVGGFNDAFFLFALVLLPVVLFIGIGTWVRMAAANYHDAIAVAGMNRIRGGYLQIAPELEPFFVMGVHDDPAGIRITMAIPPGTPTFLHLIAATPFLVMVLNAVLAGAIGALIVVRFVNAEAVIALIAAVACAAVAVAVEIRVGTRNIRRGQREVRSLFPTPPDGTERPEA